MEIKVKVEGDPGDEFERQTLPVPCPGCGFDNAVELRQVIEGDTIICRGCHANIQLADENGQLAAARDELSGFLDGLKKAFGG